MNFKLYIFKLYIKAWLQQTSRFIIIAKSVSFPLSKNCNTCTVYTY